jgi:hypothetical protein
MQFCVWWPVINTTISTVKEMFSLQQGLSGKTVRHIADSCQHLKKLCLKEAAEILDDDVIHVIKKLGKQLTTLGLDGSRLTDVTYLYLNNCVR